jgi:hypothetical protein
VRGAIFRIQSTVIEELLDHLNQVRLLHRGRPFTRWCFVLDLSGTHSCLFRATWAQADASPASMIHRVGDTRPAVN